MYEADYSFNSWRVKPVKIFIRKKLIYIYDIHGQGIYFSYTT